MWQKDLPEAAAWTAFCSAGKAGALGVVSVGLARWLPRAGASPQSLDASLQRVAGMLGVAFPLSMVVDLQPIDIALFAVEGLRPFDLSRGGCSSRATLHAQGVD